MAFPNLTDIAATTIENRSPIVADNVTKNSALFVRLNSRGNKKYFDGGSQIYQQFSFQENGNFLWYSGADQLSVNAQDVISGANYAIKQCACAVTITGLEEIQNAGKERILNLLDERMEVAENTMKNRMAEGLFSDGTGYGGKQLVGLGSLIVANPAVGTVGGIDRSTAIGTFWRNQFTGAQGAITPANVLNLMNGLWVKCVRNRDTPDLITADNNMYQAYWNSMQANQRFTSENTDVARVGFQTIKYNTADFVLDGGVGGFCPINVMYFLNTKYLFLRPFKGREFKPLAPNRRVAINQDASVAIIAWAGAFTANGLMFSGYFQGS